VQTRRAFAQELLTLQRRVFDAETDDLLVVRARFEPADHRGGQFGATERHEPLDL
jgi:hypothetical protein